MAEMCWICKKEFDKGDGMPDSNLAIHLVHLLERTQTNTGTWIKTQTKYEKTSITVPRCPACARKAGAWRLKTAGILTVVGLVVGALLLLLGSSNTALDVFSLLAGGAVGGFLLGFVSGGSVRKGFEEALAKTYPAIKTLLDSGWAVGKSY